MDKLLKWKALVKIFFEVPTYHQREIKFSFIDEKELFAADSLIFSIEKHIQSLKALAEMQLIIKATEQKKANSDTKKIIPPKPQKPEEPDQDDCCGSGCQVCVFDRYYSQLEAYEEKLMEWEEKYGENSDEEEDQQEGRNEESLNKQKS